MVDEDIESEGREIESGDEDDNVIRFLLSHVTVE